LAADIVVLAEQIRLSQVLMNLIANALDAVSDRPGGRVVVTVERQRSCALIRIDDNGPGIAPGNLDRIFDPFFTTKRSGDGLGLGLSIAYNILKDFRGRLTAENRAKGGARFEVRLPIAEAGELAAE
ncbi:MAG: ATP-binding protein, partial [Myxococcales bacterium]|nr:ATP-binding protein [Myxococcales bacterium]